MSALLSAFVRFLFFGIAELIILIACYRYLVKSKTLHSKLLFFGSLTGVVSYGIQTACLNLMISGDIDDILNYEIVSIFTGVAMFLGALAFAIGFFILIKRTINKDIEDIDEVDSIGKH